MSSSVDIKFLKKAALEAIESEKPEILKLSRIINRHPELSYKEKLASAELVSFFNKRGFQTLMPFGGLDTAFSADFNCGGSRKYPSLIAEYDALPDVGHGCAHNLIAAAAAAAAVGAAAAIKASASAGGPGGAGFRVIGTPAEEVVDRVSGKTVMLEKGAFSDTSFALMFHPWTTTGVATKDLGYSTFRMIFRGKTAHAAADPWNGRNALDAAVIFYNSVSMLRQQLPPGMRMHCILPEAGTALNVIPEYAIAEVMIRSTELDYLKKVENSLSDCASGASAASGCTFEMELLSSVKPVLFNRELFEKLEANMKASGEALQQLPLWEASSDFGDVSREIPSISLLYKTHDERTCWHSREAASEADTEIANEAMLRAAGFLALTVVDVLFSDTIL